MHTTTQLLSAAALAATILLFTRARWTVPVSRHGQRRTAAAVSASWALTLALTTSLFAVYIPNITIIGQSSVLTVRFTPEPWPGGPAMGPHRRTPAGGAQHGNRRVRRPERGATRPARPHPTGGGEPRGRLPVRPAQPRRASPPQ